MPQISLFLLAYKIAIYAFTMASTVQVSQLVRWATPNITQHHHIHINRFRYSYQLNLLHGKIHASSFRTTNRSHGRIVCCSAANKPSSSDISSTAKIRSEVLTPFRSVRMFFYLAFIASGGLGGLIALSRAIGALSNPSRAAEVPEILKGLGIDVAAVSLFAFLYARENKAKNLQIARLAREESLANLKVRVDEKRIIPVSSVRGIARLVILSGPGSFIEESFNRSKPLAENLLERGVLVVAFTTDGELPTFEFDETQDDAGITSKKSRLWQLVPFDISAWSNWINEQKQLANVASESPVYMSLRLDGRVRGSGVGYPPWNAFVAQLPPIKGMWSGLLDGFDGRV